ncbi:hypothetical protein bAD24_I04155 [Burkholderia sp. AD24]|nr:hypothetical protein bAD24_I04155 [Burkholderia sp. AD24]
MPILVVLFALGAVVYGAVRAFYALQAALGLGVAVGVAVLVGLIVVAAVAVWWRRRRDVAANVRDGDWTHLLQGDWGFVRLAAGKRLCEIRLGDQVGAYIFADLLGAEVQAQSGQSQVALNVKDPKRQVWVLPMAGERQARQWKRILMLAVEQKL